MPLLQTIENAAVKWYAGAALALVGFAGIMVGTAAYGPGMSGDSISYVACANSLLEGKGFMSHTGIYLRWPPLFPMVLAFMGLTGMDVVDASRYFNALCFGLAIFGFHHILARNLRSWFLVITGAMSVMLLDQLLKNSLMILTETMYAMLLIFLVMAFVRFLAKPGWKGLIGVSIIAALGPLTRYIGIAIIPAGCFILLFGLKDQPWKTRLGFTTVFGLITSIPIVAWLARNYVLTDSLAGPRWIPRHTLSHIMEANARVITGFVFPESVPLAVRLIMVLAAIAAFIYLARRFPAPKRKTWGTPQVIGVMILAYMAMLLYSYLTTGLDAIPIRYLTPVQFCFVFFALYFLDRMIQWAGLLHPQGKHLEIVLAVVCALWLGNQALHILSRTSLVVNNPNKHMGWIEKTAARNPTTHIYTTKAKALFDRGEFLEAAQAFEKAAELAEDPGPSWLEAAKAYNRGGDVEKAVWALNKAGQYLSSKKEAGEMLKDLERFSG